jgi:hypothetical protein
MFIDERTMERIRRSNNEAIFGELRCCGEMPDFIVMPPFSPKNNWMLAFRCKKCRKEERISVDKDMKYANDDPVFSESIKILKEEWNKNENRA